MGDQHRGNPQFALNVPEEFAQVAAQGRVERGERLVEEQDGRTAHHRARERHALLLTAGDLSGPALLETGESEAVDQASRTRAALLPLEAVPAIEHVLEDRHVREERQALEDIADGAPLRGQADPTGRVEEQAARRDHAAVLGLREARDQPQGERLAGAGGSEKDRQLRADLPGDIEFEAGQRRPQRHGEAAHGALRVSRVAAYSASAEMPVKSRTRTCARPHSPFATAP